MAFLGDSSVDEDTAKNAGVSFWAFKNPELSGELLVPDFSSAAFRPQACRPELPALS